MSTFDILKTGSSVIDRVVSSIDNNRVSEKSSASPANGKLLSNIAVTTSSSSVAHGLGRKASGAILVASDALVTIAAAPSGTTNITIVGSTTATVSLWVF